MNPAPRRLLCGTPSHPHPAVNLFQWIVLMEHPTTGVSTPIASLMAQTKKQAERRAHALYTDRCWVQSAASHRVGADREERLLGRMRKEDRRWMDEEDDDSDELP